jgi:hypothetical protein
MLKEQEPAAGLEDAAHFAQGLVNLIDAAQRERADDAIESACLKGQLFAADNPLVHFDSRLPDAPLRQPVHAGVRLDDGDPGNALGIKRQVQPGSEADLQNLAVGAREEIAPVPGYDRVVQEEIAKARENYARIETHGRLQNSPTSIP